MTTDPLVAALRKHGSTEMVCGVNGNAIADEIERLTAERDRAVDRNDVLVSDLAMMEVERDRLRAELERTKSEAGFYATLSEIYRLRAAIEKHRERMRDEEQHPADTDLWDALAGAAE